MTFFYASTLFFISAERTLAFQHEVINNALSTNSTFQAYFGLLVFLLIASALCTILAGIAYLLSLSTAQEAEKRSEYECGFAPFDSATRLPFDVHFYLVGILFLIFDVEVALLFPWVLSLRTFGWAGFFLMIAFVLILTVGFVYEWKRGALIWPSRYNPDRVEFTGSAFQLIPMLFTIQSPEESIEFFIEDPLVELASTPLVSLPDLFVGCAAAYLLLYISDRRGGVKALSATMLSGWTALTVVYATITILYLLQALYASTGLVYDDSGHFAFNPWASCIKLLLLLYGAVITSFAQERRSDSTTEFPVLILFCTFFLALLSTSTHLMITFFTLAGASLVLYVLMLVQGAQARAQDVTVRYFVQSSLSTLLALFGLMGIFMLAGTGYYAEVMLVFSGEQSKENFFALTIFVTMLLTGLLFKLSSFPGHFWAPDTYEGVSTAVLAIFAVAVKAAVMVALIRLLLTPLESLSTIWVPVLSISITGSLLIGTFGGVEEKIFARFLAFSGINHIAFMLLGIVCNSPEGVSAAIFYLIVYAATSLGLFIILLSISITREGRAITFLTDLLHIGKIDTRFGILLSTLLLSMAGLPPLPGFFSKFFVLIEAMRSEFYFLVILGLATSVVSTFYYLRLVKILLFELAIPTNTRLAIRSKLYTPTLAILEIGMWSFGFFAWMLLLATEEIAASLGSVVTTETFSTTTRVSYWGVICRKGNNYHAIISSKMQFIRKNYFIASILCGSISEYP